MVENSYSHKITALRRDREGEYLFKTYHDFCVNSGIHHALTCAYTSHQNGVCEQKNRTVLRWHEVYYFMLNYLRLFESRPQGQLFIF